jgi:methionyl-tRNA synthetase
MPRLLVHGWWNLGGAKMSKSAGNIIDPFALIEKYGADAVRYYLMSDIATGKDADFTEERLVERYDSDLANKLGNLLNRSLTMTQKYRNGVVKKPTGSELAGLQGEADSWVKYVDWWKRKFDKLSINPAIAVPFLYASGCNEFVEANKPWSLAGDTASADLLDRVLYTLAESLRIIAILISPVLPKAAHGIFDQLNWKMELSGKEERFALKDAEWGRLPDGHVVGTPVPLFPRIETTGL